MARSPLLIDGVAARDAVRSEVAVTVEPERVERLRFVAAGARPERRVGGSSQIGAAYLAQRRL
jgi:hypothetical protein